LHQKTKITIITPVFNDWQSLLLLLHEINTVGIIEKFTVNVLVINDGSVERFSRKSFDELAKDSIESITIINLRRNLGNQRAIAIGVAYASEHYVTDPVIVMDSDGEDKPEDIPLLILTYQQTQDKIVFAERVKRSEGLVFRVLYFFYKKLYKILTGTAISFGNFSIIPPILLNNLVAVPEIWMHYSAGILRSKLPITTVPTKRGKRLAGESKVNIVFWVMHGLGAFSVHLDIVSVRLLLIAITSIGISVAGIIIVLCVKVFTDWAIPGWATSTIGTLAIILIQMLLLSLLLVFVVLNSRSQQAELFHLQYKQYIFNINVLSTIQKSYQADK